MWHTHRNSYPDYLDKNMTFFGQQIPVPDTTRTAEANAVSGSASLGQKAAECASLHGQNPTYLLVDFVSLEHGFADSGLTCATV